MSLYSDAKLAYRLLRNAWRSRQSRRRVAALSNSTVWPTAEQSQLAVYFSDTTVNLYQIRQWYAPLVELSKTHPVVIIVRSPGTMLALAKESPLPVVYLRKILELETFVNERDIKVMFYVNQNAKNFQMMRYSRMWHVFVNHGESDKSYMTSNQFKSYDYALVAGQAALDRLSHKLWNYDVEARALPIGRPQADHFFGDLPYTPDERTVVLYAPTWEGDRISMRYGSIESHGVALTQALLASGKHRLIYRPHPRSGVVDGAYKSANRAIIAAIARANAADPSAQHVFDDGPELGWQLTAADVAVTDISAMVYDRLATGKPLIVTRPLSPQAEVDENGYLGDCEWLRADDAASPIPILERVQSSDEARARLQHWVTHHFGDTTPGASTARFHAAVQLMVDQWHRFSALHASDPRERDSDPFASDDDEEGMPAGN